MAAIPYQPALAAGTRAAARHDTPPNPEAEVDVSGRGGWYWATVNGVTGRLRVYVSRAFPTWNESLNRKWAKRFVALPHGNELSKLVVYLSPYDEVSSDDVCGTDADSCYEAETNEMYLAVDQPSDNPYQIAMHEYGHHIANSLETKTWDAVDLGPKHWAAAAQVRKLTREHRLWPGDQDEHWFENPGEIWAETYRVVASNFVGVRPDPWDSVEDTWNPAKRPALMAAALLDTSPKLTSAARLIDPFVAQWPQAIKQPGA
jgi:hypothetical protein